MSFGEQVLAVLRRRGLQSHFRYADIQAMKAIADAEAMHARLTEKGYEVEVERTEPLHFADLITIEIFRRRLATSQAAAVFFAIT